jgi:hypothetical protein
MARTKIRYDQAADTDFVEEKELLSDGTLSQSGPFNIVSVTSSTKQIVVSTGDFEDDGVAAGDILVISGGTANDGSYTVDQVIDNNTLSVLEAVSDAGAAGTAETFYPPADERIGIQDPGGAYTHSGTYETLDDHIQDATAHSSAGGGITEAQHEDLDTLVHNLSEDMYEEFVYTGARVDDIIVWTDSGKTTKIRETNFSYSANKVVTEVIKQYDSGGTLKVILTGTYNYTGNQLDDITWVEV